MGSPREFLRLSTGRRLELRELVRVAYRDERTVALDPHEVEALLDTYERGGFSTRGKFTNA